MRRTRPAVSSALAVSRRSSLLAGRVAQVGLAEGWGEDFSRAVYRAEFGEGLNIGEPAVIATIVGGLGHDARGDAGPRAIRRDQECAARRDRRGREARHFRRAELHHARRAVLGQRSARTSVILGKAQLTIGISGEARMTFLPEAHIIAAYTAAALLLIVTPGPDMTLFLGQTLTAGRARGMAAMFGASPGLWCTRCWRRSDCRRFWPHPPPHSRHQDRGRVYLVWLAIQAIRHGSALTLAGSAGAAAARRCS